MAQTSDGMTYDPRGKQQFVVGEGDFVFAAARLDHDHIRGMTSGLKAAGGTLKYIYDENAEKAQSFAEIHPEAKVVSSLEEILGDERVHCVASAAIPNERCELGLKVMDAGKDYFTDKSPFTTMDQLESARIKVSETGRKYMVYYSERLHNGPSLIAGDLVRDGQIGQVLQVSVMAPHRLSKERRPDWFFDKEKYGGILTDIGSHQFEQLLYFTGSTNAKIEFARVDNRANADKPGLEDFGEALLSMNSGASCHCRVDWFTPDAARAWGDGRMFVLGTKGYIEVRKYLDLGQPEGGPRVLLVNQSEERVISVEGEQHYPFFGELILDVLNRSENAMTQDHAFKAAELSMKAQEFADRARSSA